MEAQGHKNLPLTAREWAQLSELCEILEPFLEATNIAQGNNCVTISNVLPATLALRTHLMDWNRKVKYCQPVVRALLASLLKRFSGLYNRATPPKLRLHVPNKFGNGMYVIAAILDPAFRMQWLEVDVVASQVDKEELHREVVGKVECTIPLLVIYLEI